MEQLLTLKSHPRYRDKKYLMRHFVSDFIAPVTDGTGIGYALLLNQEKPLRAKIMVSHAWDEPIKDFVEAIERSGEVGPFWICALAIYQNGDRSKGVTISEQLGTDPEAGPFATVLKGADLMLAVLTEVCNIYTRLWCVYEMYFAIQNGVTVRLASHISEDDLYNGQTFLDICVSEAKNRIDSDKARCGPPGSAINDDERAIRKVISSSTGKFKGVDEVVERIRLAYLASYPVHLIEYNKIRGYGRIKDAIKQIIPCFPSNPKLKTFEAFLDEKLLAHPGFKKTPKGYHIDCDHDYYIENEDCNTKIDIFKEWSSSLQEALQTL